MSFFEGAAARIRRMMPGHEDANGKAFGNGFILIVLCVITVIALFLDIVFVTMIWSALPDGFLRYVAAGGAILVSPVILLVLLAKLFYFRKGGQFIFSFFVFGIDILFAILNTYCAFQIAWRDENAFVIAWRDLSPITPIVLMVMLSILLMLDPYADRRSKLREHDEKSRDLDMQFAREEKARQLALREMEAEFKSAQEEAKIQVQMEMLEEYKKMLMEEMKNHDALAVIREGARRLVATEVHGLTGLPLGSVSPALLMQQPVQLAQQANVPVLPVTSPLPDTQDYLDLLDKAVRYGQISDEKAQPLRDMLAGTRPLAKAPSSQNGHQNGAKANNP